MESQVIYDTFADDYERSRPDYPLDVVEDIVGFIPGPRPQRVLEIGTGTGKFGRQLQTAGLHPIGLDPAFRVLLKARNLASDLDCVQARAEELPIQHLSMEAVFAAQCFHLVDKLRMVAEVFRVLRNEHYFVITNYGVMFKTTPHLETAEQSVAECVPSYASSPLRPGDFPEEMFRYFDLIDQQYFHYSFMTDAKGYISFLGTRSQIRSGLADPGRRDLLEKIYLELRAHVGDAPFVVPMKLEAYYWRKH